MSESKKELILDRIESRLREIKRTNIAYQDVHYSNDVGYVDRQFLNITEQDIKQHGTNWIVMNEIREDWNPLVGGPYENKLRLQMIGFVQALQKDEKLGTLMNSLQKDIMLAMIKDVELDRLCSYLVPVSNHIVDNMIYPYGGFAMYFDITYVTQGFEI